MAVRRWYLQHEQENMRQILLYLMRKWYDIVFLSHSIHQEDPLADDYIFARSFALKYRLPITRKIRETLEAYRYMDFVIWMRFHSVILSIVHNIPFIALDYSPKVTEILKKIDYDAHITSKDFDFEKFIIEFEKLENDTESRKLALKKKYDKIRKDLDLKYNTFLDGLEITQRESN